MSAFDAAPANAWTVLAAAIVAVSAGVNIWLTNRVHRNVSVNHHSSKKPTLPDRLDDVGTDLSAKLDQIATKVDDHREDFREYREETAQELVRVWEAINEKADRRGR